MLRLNNCIYSGLKYHHFSAAANINSYKYRAIFLRLSLQYNVGHWLSLLYAASW